MANTVTPASQPVTGYAASIQYESDFVLECVRARNWRKKMTQPLGSIGAAGMIDDGNTLKTDAGWPIVEIWNLSVKNQSGGGMGDRVTVDLELRVGGVPVPGDTDATSTGQPLTWSRDQVTLLAQTFVVDGGGMMDRQRSPHNLRQRALKQGPAWVGDYEDLAITVALAGARGFDTRFPEAIPLQAQPGFVTAMSNNPVTPPTLNRYSLPSGSNNITTVDATQKLVLNSFDLFRTIVAIAEVPLHGLAMSAWGTNGETVYDVNDRSDPIWAAFISEEQWNSLMTSTDAQNWRYYLSQANLRLDFVKHPLFGGSEVLVWRNIIISKMPRPIIFPQGSSVPYYATVADQNTGTISQFTTPVRLHRGFILGAQALACVYGDATPIASGKQATRGAQTSVQGTPFSWVEETFNFGKQIKVACTMMPGYKKLVYTHRGQTWDNGVFTFDSYQPLIGTSSP